MITIQPDPVADRVRGFIAEVLLFGDQDGLPSDELSLLRGGIIDSTDVMELICFVEEAFGITVDDADVVPQNFDSVRGISEYVRTRQDAAE